MPAKRDYYEVLGVERTVDVEIITKAYRKLAMQHHPDRNVGDDAALERFKEAAEAYDVLRDENKRARYDRYGHAGLEGMGGGGGGPGFQSANEVFDLFGNLFGDMMGGQRGGPQPGRNIQVQVDLDLGEAYRGVKKSVTFPREELCGDCSGSGARKGTVLQVCPRCQGQGVFVQRQGFFQIKQTCRACNGRGSTITDPCPTCRGGGRVSVRRTVEVPIPAGVDSGIRVRQGGEGEAGDPGMARGDLLLMIRVREHKLFQRDGDHLLCQVPVTFSQAALGGEIEIPTLDGPVKHHLPRGTQSGEVLRLTGKGIPNVHGGRRGDLHVQILLETPRNLTKRQEELLRELAEIDHKNVSAERKGWLESIKEFFTAEGEAERK